jgi:hypothetical protein
VHGERAARERDAVRDRALLFGVDVDALEVAHRGGERQDCVVGRRFDVGERARLVEVERADSQPTQLAEVRAPAERGAEVGGERPDVSAAAALDQHGGGGIGAGLELLDVETVDANVTRRPFDLLAFLLF